MSENEIDGQPAEAGPTEWGENPNGVGPWSDTHDEPNVYGSGWRLPGMNFTFWSESS